MNNEYSVNTDVPARRNRRSHPRVVHPGRSPGPAAPLPGAPDPARRSAAARSACAGLAALLLVLLVLAALAAVLGVVVLLDVLHRRLVALLVGADHHELAEEVGVHVRVGERAGAREELLDVCLVRQVSGYQDSL